VEDFTLPDTDDEFTIGADDPVAGPPAETADEAPPDASELPFDPGEPAFLRDEPAFVPVEAPVQRAPRRATVARDDSARAERVKPRRRPERDAERGKVVAVFLFLTTVVIAYSVATATLFAEPALWDRWLGNLPWIGTLRDDRLLTRKVALSDVAGSYQRIKDGKEVFVITGKAMNTAPVALHGVQIAGKLLDENGRAVDEKTIHCGNVISTKVLKDLTRRELSVLQTLNPPSRFMIEPGESSTFVIVFMDPPRAASSFTTNVVAAHRQA